MNKTRLFCFPYAGGSAMVYNQWAAYLDRSVVLRPVELAGRGNRIHEPLYQDIPAAVMDIYKLIADEIDRMPYALFGHSMGCLITYELAQFLRERGKPQPVHIFFSGKGAPHIRRNDEKMFHLMSDERFRDEVLKLGGTPPEFFEHPELLDLFLPVLKNDFRITETAVRHSHVRPLESSITVFLGKDDDLDDDECQGWKAHTQQTCNIRYFDGGHFFLHDHAQQVVQHINHILQPKVYSF